jgi:2-polyprenyl-3-methyl-5-hydroxy-6-metoxy-1,4-benzoquinol methylase
MKRLYYLFILRQRGHGKPISKDVWEAEYQRGDWNYLDRLDELPHYMVTVGYISHLHPSPNILDVGCGHGRLLELLHPMGFAHYHSIDLSAVALEKATALGIPNTTFEEADFEQWEANRRFNIIVFNETLVYAHWPVDVLSRYAAWLEDNGSIIISMFRYGNHRRLWKNIGKHFPITHASTVETTPGRIWDVRIIHPKPITRGS